MDKIPDPPKSLQPSQLMNDCKMEESNNLFNSNGQLVGHGCQNKVDEQIIKLKREMIGLRQLDMSLLSQLNALKQSILDYKRVLNGESVDYDGQNASVPKIKPRTNVKLDDYEDLTGDEQDLDDYDTTSHSSV